MKLVADRLDRISPSLTIAMTTKARALKAAGKDVIGLSSGEPDFDTPRNIKDAAIAAIERGETKYTDVAGTLELRTAVCARFKADHGVEFKPEEILVATGGKQVIFDALLATTTSSSDRVKASSQPAASAGAISGRVTVRNAVKGGAPRSAAASSSSRPRSASRACTTTAT